MLTGCLRSLTQSTEGAELTGWIVFECSIVLFLSVTSRSSYKHFESSFYDLRTRQEISNSGLNASVDLNVTLARPVQSSEQVSVQRFTTVLTLWQP